MRSANFFRQLFAIAGLLCLVLWLPVAAVTYLPGWHAASCNWHERCDSYGRAAALERIDELRAFMWHDGELAATAWTEKERSHLAEVRSMLDRWLLFAALGALVVLHADREQRARAARWSLFIAAGSVIVLPFFAGFWREVFHPLLFDNNNWLNGPADTSYWIMPRLYFRHTVALVIGSATLLAALLLIHARRR